MRLMETNYCTEASTTVTVSSANSNFPGSNLKHPFRSKVWRSTGTTSETATFDFQTTEEIDSVVLLWPKESGIKLTGSAVIKVQANATDSWSSPALDQTLTVSNDYSVASHYFTDPETYRFWRIVIEDPGNPWDYLELGVVWIGKSLEVENAQNGFKYSLIDQSKITSTDFGHLYADEYPLTATLEFQYALMDYDAIQVLENAYRVNGSRKPVLVNIDAEEAVFNKDHFMIYGNFTDTFGVGHSFYNVLQTDGIKITELS